MSAILHAMRNTHAAGATRQQQAAAAGSEYKTHHTQHHVSINIFRMAFNFGGSAGFGFGAPAAGPGIGGASVLAPTTAPVGMGFGAPAAGFAFSAPAAHTAPFGAPATGTGIGGFSAPTGFGAFGIGADFGAPFLPTPPAAGAGSDKPVDASADQKIIAAQDAMACIDATVRTLLVSARALQTQERGVVGLCRVLSSAPFSHPSLLLFLSSQDEHSGLDAAGPELLRNLQQTRACLQLELCSLKLQRISVHLPAALQVQTPVSIAPASHPRRRTCCPNLLACCGSKISAPSTPARHKPALKCILFAPHPMLLPCSVPRQPPTRSPRLHRWHRLQQQMLSLSSLPYLASRLQQQMSISSLLHLASNRLQQPPQR